MIQALLPLLADGLVIVGLVTLTVAVYGVLRMPDPMTRLHAASKPVGLGVVPILLAAIISGGPALVGPALLTAFFLVVTSPVSAHIIGRAIHREQEQPESHGAAAGSHAPHPARTTRLPD
jgi:monovalent cation/proton antiporter MnhG/PhaG subunit